MRLKTPREIEDLFCEELGLPLGTPIDQKIGVNGLLYALGICILNLKFRVNVIRWVLGLVIVCLFALFLKVGEVL